MQIFAHRGTSGHDPENTLRAFRGALAAGADGVEFDVRATSDGVPVILHDRDVARTTDGHGNVDELTLEQVKELDAGEGERIPTLDEVLDLLGDRVKLYVEIAQPGIEAEVRAVLNRYPDSRWFVASFNLAVLRTFRALEPHAELWIIGYYPDDEIFAAARELTVGTLSLRYDLVSPEVAKRCEDAGLDLAVWTVNSVGEALAMREFPMVAICTDFPAELKAGLLTGT